jgi:hypothetical protein
MPVHKSISMCVQYLGQKSRQTGPSEAVFQLPHVKVVGTSIQKRKADAHSVTTDCRLVYLLAKSLHCIAHSVKKNHGGSHAQQCSLSFFHALELSARLSTTQDLQISYAFPPARAPGLSDWISPILSQQPWRQK